MSLPLFLQGLGSISVFASRAFLPAFATALLLRFGPHLPELARFGLLPRVQGVPTWFTSDLALVIFGLLAALELAAERSAEAKGYLDEVHRYLKAGMAALTYLGALSTTERAVVSPLLHQAGFGDFIPALAVAGGTLLVARTRDVILGPLGEADEDDDLGLQKLLRWAGDGWGAVGPLALVLLPLLTLAGFGVAVVLLVVIERRVVARGDRLLVGCASCGRSIHPSALVCPMCRAPVASPRGVGLLGRPKETPADLAALPNELIAVKRCPRCATRFDRRGVRQTCRACGHRLLDDPGEVQAYIAAIDRRVPLACLVGLALGLIPVLGLILGVIYSRLLIIAPYRRYIPAGQGLLVRWGVRLAIVVLVGLQWVPVAGALTVPALSLITYAAYRTAYRKLALAA